MTSPPLDRNLETQVDPQQEYRALVRSLKYTQGFGLLFVQCSPAEGGRIIARVRNDLPQKRIEVLTLTEPIDTLYDKVEALYGNESGRESIDVLFVQGIEHSLYEYEKTRLWSDEAQRRNYSETAVPRLLQHLNLSREKFRENFAFHFVFLVPHFVLKYLTRRAPDFFDWNSGVLEFVTEQEQLHQESSLAAYGAWRKDDPWTYTQDEYRQNLLEIQALIEEPHQTTARKADLFFEQGRLLAIAQAYEEAITSYDKALHIKPNYHTAWNNRGSALSNLGRYEEAIASFDKAIHIKPNDHAAWNNRGIALRNLGRYEGAIASYDKALLIKPDDHEAWYNRGIALGRLGRYEEAIASFDKALHIKPDKEEAFYNKACSYARQNDLEAAIAHLSRAIELNAEQNREMAKTDSDFDSIREHEAFQELIAG